VVAGAKRSSKFSDMFRLWPQPSSGKVHLWQDNAPFGKKHGLISDFTNNFYPFKNLLIFYVHTIRSILYFTEFCYSFRHLTSLITLNSSWKFINKYLVSSFFHPCLQALLLSFHPVGNDIWKGGTSSVLLLVSCVGGSWSWLVVPRRQETGERLL
jgi:hypothetical protein